MDLSTYRSFLIALAKASGAYIAPFFANAELVVETKADASPVTLADRGAEDLMRRMIRETFPDHGILGEEYGAERLESDWVWVLDPIDGTKAFTTACPLFGTLIALQYQGQPVLGAIHQPILGQLMIGDGKTTELNGKRVRCRGTRTLAEATLLTSDPVNPEKFKNGPAYARLERSVKIARTWGDCYGYLLVASGWADVANDPIMNTWDIAALIPILRGAGGVITSWEGKDPVGADSCIASATPELHAAVLAMLHP